MARAICKFISKTGRNVQALYFPETIRDTRGLELANLKKNKSADKINFQGIGPRMITMKLLFRDDPPQRPGFTDQALVTLREMQVTPLNSSSAASVIAVLGEGAKEEDVTASEADPAPITYYGHDIVDVYFNAVDIQIIRCATDSAGNSIVTWAEVDLSMVVIPDDSFLQSINELGYSQTNKYAVVPENMKF